MEMSDSISRKWLMECVNGIKFETEKDENIIIHLVRDIAPSAQSEITEEDVREWCYKRCLTIVDNAWYASLQRPVRETAEWVYGERDGADGWYCSKCGFHIPWYYDYYGLNNINFISDFHTCPHCDAKMIKYTGKDGKQNG